MREALRTLALVLCAAFPAAADEVQLAGGATVTGRVVSVAGDRVAVRVGDSVLQKRTADVAEIRFAGKALAPAGGDRLRLREGGRLVGRVSLPGGEQVVVETAAFGAVPLTLDGVAEIVFAGAKGPAGELPEAERGRDHLWLRGGRRLPPGLVKGADAEGLRFDCSLGENLAVPRAKIARLVLRGGAGGVRGGGLRFAVETRDGCAVTGRALAVAAGVCRVTAGRLRLRADTAACRRVRVMGGRVVYLSDLDPARVITRPFFDAAWPVYWRRDRTWGGNPIRLRGRAYAKGLGCRPYCELRYALAGKYDRFACTVGVDDEAGGRGAVVFRVRVDGREAFAGKAMTGRDAPVSVSVPVRGARQLSLVVDFGSDVPLLNRAVWADARLLRGAGE